MTRRVTDATELEGLRRVTDDTEWEALYEAFKDKSTPVEEKPTPVKKTRRQEQEEIRKRAMKKEAQRGDHMQVKAKVMKELKEKEAERKDAKFFKTVDAEELARHDEDEATSPFGFGEIQLEGGSKTRKKSRKFRNNLRKNKISRKYIMLKQCGGKKAKKGAKSNPFSSKAKASRSRRKGQCYYKKKGRTLKLGKKGKKRSRKRSRRRRRRR